MNFRQLQLEAGEWRKRNFPETDHRDATAQLLGIVEEVGELSHAQLKGLQGIREFRDPLERMRATEAKIDAVGDIIIFLTGYCDAEGIDLQTAVEATWDRVKKRNWIENPQTGVA